MKNLGKVTGILLVISLMVSVALAGQEGLIDPKDNRAVRPEKGKWNRTYRKIFDNS